MISLLSALILTILDYENLLPRLKYMDICYFDYSFKAINVCK